ncbi:MAG: elongation factor P--(R)-beta-lysine ligase [Porticoccaceae bacterium]|nr:MAG: elongation factor P--(R)-beta-lysine ligase [Porticoccaceae bacterium]
MAQIRAFFAERGVLEVDVPLLGEAAATDPALEPIAVEVDGATLYLQTSPEHYLKRLLAQGVGPVYALTRAFRGGEHGARHRREFTLLEWYRPGWQEEALMAEVVELVERLAGRAIPVTTLDYGDAFAAATGLDPHGAPLALLAAAAAEVAGGDWAGEARSTLLELLFALRVEPRLPAGLAFVVSYPACQAALARLERDARGRTVARRFELYWDGLELANGYYELADAAEQAARFAADNARRRALGKPEIPVDEQLLSALRAGLPDCSGVALGVDRLLMRLFGAADLGEVIPFA